MEFLGTEGATLGASVGAVTSATVADLLPVAYFIGGIILAFVFIRWIVDLVKKAGSRK